MLPGEDVQDYWEGVMRSDGTPRYITSPPLGAGRHDDRAVRIPADTDLYGSFAGTTLPHVVIVCYPTSMDNSRPDYPLPNGKSVPKMQRAGDAPWWPDAATRFPILLFSHGYLGSPISNDYIEAVALLASYGYVVVAPFHGDGRFGSLQLENIGDLAYLALHLRDFLAMQAVRPLALSAALDVLLADARWANHVMAAEVGGFGASLGGESFLLMAGAGLTTSLGLAWTKIETDPRIKAAVGYVPYMGVPLFPAFGRDQRSLNDVTLPYLAIAGTADTTAPIIMTAQALNALAGPRELVALTGVPHRFDAASAPDIFTWALTFLDAEIRGDPDARAQLAQMAQVAGGGDDNVVIPLNIPAEPQLHRALVERARRLGAGLGHQPPARGQRHLPHVVHLRRERQAVVARDDGRPHDATAPIAARFTKRADRPSSQRRSIPPPSSRCRSAPERCRSLIAKRRVRVHDRQRVADQDDHAPGVRTPSVVRVWHRRSTRRARPTTRTCGGTPRRVRSPAGGSTSRTRATSSSRRGSPTTWAGSPLWLVATMPIDASGRYAGTLYRLTGPPYSASPCDPTAREGVRGGRRPADVHLRRSQAHFEYTVDGLSQTKTITREVLRATGNALPVIIRRCVTRHRRASPNDQSAGFFHQRRSSPCGSGGIARLTPRQRERQGNHQYHARPDQQHVGGEGGQLICGK